MKKNFRITVIVATLVVAMLGVPFEAGARGKALIRAGKTIVKPPKLKIPSGVKFVPTVRPVVPDVKPIKGRQLPSVSDLLARWTVKELVDTTDVRLPQISLPEFPQLLPVVDVGLSAQTQGLLPTIPQLDHLYPVVWIGKRPRSMKLSVAPNLGSEENVVVTNSPMEQPLK